MKVVPTAGGEARELLPDPRHEIWHRTGLAWTRDGGRLLFGRRQGSGQEANIELWCISARGGEPEKIGVAMPVIQSLAVHPDGRRIAFAGGYPKKLEVWALKNFLPTLTSAR